MALYLDASILVAIHEDEPTRPLFADLLMSGIQPVLISDFSLAETSGALMTLWRANRQETATTRAELERFDLWTGDLADRVHISAADIANATALVRREHLLLRAPDAIHIAATGRLAATLLTLDRGMSRAAAALGIACINPAESAA